MSHDVKAELSWHLCHSQSEYKRAKPPYSTAFTINAAQTLEAFYAVTLDEGRIMAVRLYLHERLVNNERALLVPHLGTHTETLAEMRSHAM
jgi:glyoxylate reductase